MAVCAIRGIGVFLKISLTVTALDIVFRNLSMTIRAVNTTCGFAGTMSLRVDIRMTLHAGDASVCGILDVFFLNC
jgi:hypothetical protein